MRPKDSLPLIGCCEGWYTRGRLLTAAVAALLCACTEPDMAPQQPPAGSTYIPPHYRPSRLDKIDLLFVIDNSASMADKQQVLAEAVPDLVERLAVPRCIGPDGTTVAAGAGPCPDDHPGREFDPVNDMHIGVISSSLGGHGADTCSDTPTSSYNPRQEDMAHLLSPDVAAPTWDNKGFLLWDNTSPEKYNPPGDMDIDALVAKFHHIVVGTGQDGCGFEAPLEAWYRFLVEPAPHARMVPSSCATNQPQEGGGCRGPSGIDETVLQQRQDFLRPDSMLVIVMLTDENDCSVIDGWQNYLVLQTYAAGTTPWRMPRATSECTANPDSPGCMSCLQGDHSGDPECQKGFYDEQGDSLNLRCYRQKQRFGIDFLYPIRRYVNALSKKTFGVEDVQFPVNPGFVPDQDINPIFCPQYEKDADGKPDPTRCRTVIRDPKLVFFAAITGVPWQDIANDPTDLKKGYRPVEELAWTKTQFDMFNKGKDASMKRPVPPGVTHEITVWDQILGKVNDDWGSGSYLQIDYSPAGEPLDPLMVESVAPRSGINPATGAPLVAPWEPIPASNPVNGHEWDITRNDDLQYACVFPLPEPRDCTNNKSSCDCADAEGMHNPVCQAPKGEYGKVQYRAKAYPGRRQLAVAHGLDEEQVILASICPANLSDPGAEDYGYRPAMGTIVERLRGLLDLGRCFNERLEYADDGSVECGVLEGSKLQDGASACPSCESLAWRKTPDAETVAAMHKDMNFIENGLQCLCEIPQASPGPQLDACITSTQVMPSVDGAEVDGWCYVDPEQYPGAANAGLVRTCPPGAKRVIRYVGAGAPRAGTLAFFRCRGANL